MRERRESLLSPAQQRLWFLEQLAPGSPQYNCFQAYELHGRLDAGALSRALGALADRHEALRMNFAAEAGSPTATLSEPPTTVRLERTDLETAGHGGAPPEQAVTDLASRWSRRPFDLAHDPLMRAHLVRLQMDRHILMLCFHHIIIDGWSAPIIDEELGAVYAAQVTGSPAGLPPLKAGYTDYSRRQHERLRSPEAARHLAYWRERLAGAPPLLTLPADRPRPRVQRFDGADLRIPVPAEVAAGMGEVARGNRATPFMVAFTAFAVLLARYGRTDDIVVGVVEAGRSRPEFASTVGFFVQTLPIRLALPGDPSFLTVLAGTREALFGAYEHDLLSFDMLVERLGVERDLSYTPLVQVIFQLLYLPPIGSATRWHDLDVLRWGEGVTRKSTRFDLELHLMDDGHEGFDLDVCYNVDLFDEATVRDLVETYLRLLRAVCADPRRPLSELHARVEGPAGQVRVSVRDDNGVRLPRGALGRLWLDDEDVGTGRLARMRPDGTVEHLGPGDGELLVRGCRVPASVIEDALTGDPEVASARVRADPSGSALVADLVAAPGRPERTLPSSTDLRRRLRKRLPAFLIPTSFRWEHEPPHVQGEGGDQAMRPDAGRAQERPPEEPKVFVVTRDELGDGP